MTAHGILSAASSAAPSIRGSWSRPPSSTSSCTFFTSALMSATSASSLPPSFPPSPPLSPTSSQRSSRYATPKKRQHNQAQPKQGLHKERASVCGRQKERETERDRDRDRDRETERQRQRGAYTHMTQHTCKKYTTHMHPTGFWVDCLPVLFLVVALTTTSPLCLPLSVCLPLSFSLCLVSVSSLSRLSLSLWFVCLFVCPWAMCFVS